MLIASEYNADMDHYYHDSGDYRYDPYYDPYFGF